MSCEMAYRLEQEPASFLRRAAAFLIDVAIVAAIWFATVVAAVIPDNSGEEDLSEPSATIVVVLVLAPGLLGGGVGSRKPRVAREACRNTSDPMAHRTRR